MAHNFMNTPRENSADNMTVIDVPTQHIAPGAPAVPDPEIQQNPFEAPDTSSDFEIARRLQAEENAANLPWPRPLIKLHGLVVRPYHPSDAPAMARIANNRNISRNMTDRFPYPYTVKSAEEFIAKALDAETTNTYAWAVSLTKDSEPIGGCGLEPGPDVFARNAEIGYWLGEEHWGKGYATQICQALTDWGFRQENGVTGQPLQRIGAGVYDQNHGSGKVLKRCGYAHEGTMRDIVYKWGEVRSMEIWGITKKEWEKKQKRISKKEQLRLVDMTEQISIGMSNSTENMY